MPKTPQKISEGLIKIDTEIKKCYETQIRTFLIFDLKLFERLILEHQLSNILDIGCGEGSFILHIAKKFPQIKIHAVETIPNLLAESKIKQDKQSIRNIYFENTIFDENFPKSECDLITARFAVEQAIWFVWRCGLESAMVLNSFVRN